MLSKEEIEKAKEFMKFYKNHCLNLEIENIKNYKTVNDGEFVSKNIEILLQYIDQLEQENKALKKGQTSLMSSRKKWKDRYYKLKAKNKEAYWKGYIQKQNEAMEICQMCKYRKQYFEKKVDGK